MKSTLSGLILAGGVFALPVYAINISENVYWYDGDNAGQKAATCIYHTPDRQPFADALTLVVDNSLGYGSVLWSWDYATFLADYTLSCTGSGIDNSSNRLQDAVHGNPSNWQLRLTAQGGSDLMPTTNPGVGIRWYFHTPQGEIVKDKPQQTVSAGLDVSASGAGRYVFNPRKTVTLSARAELVKTGNVAYGTPISPLTTQSQLWLEAGTAQSSSINLGQGGITPVAPACRLSTKAYLVDMGRWVAQNSRQMPARGAETPFELQLECSGQIAHLRLRFEDSGTRTSANQNVSLYRESDGESIEGLEVEMLFNGNRINIGDSEALDTGSRGHRAGGGAAIYEAAAPVVLTARYVQHNAMTSSGKPYIGNISGKVNIWVTYD